MRKHAFGLVVASFLSVLLPGFLHAAWVPPPGFTRTSETFVGDAFAVAPDGKVAIGTANFSGGASIKIYASAAAAQAAGSPIRTFTDPTYKAWGDLTFTDSDTLLFSENVDKDTVYRGIISSGGSAALAPPGSVPNGAGVVQVGSTVYATAANNPGTGALYAINAGAASAALSNIGTGYVGGLAVDSAGNFLLTDSNDPAFAGNPGKLLRYTSGFAALPPVDLAGGNGSGAYDVVLDTEGDALVTTGSTLTRIPFGTTLAQQFGTTFTGFPFITNLDYIGAGFEPNLGNAKLFVNAVFSDDGKIIGVTPIPEPASALLLIGVVLPIVARRRRHFAVPLVGSLAVFATVLPTSAAHFYATQVISTSVGSQQQAGFTDPSVTLGGPRGGGTTSASIDVYSLGNGGSLTLGFDTPTSQGKIVDGPGFDFLVAENPFYQSDDQHRSFAELMYVEVSSDGVHFARFTPSSRTPAPVPAFGVIDPDDVFNFAGVNPVLANVDENTIDAFDPAAAGGDAFDLAWIKYTQGCGCSAGMVDVNNIRYVRLVDVIGDGSTLDRAGRPIYDPTGPGIGGADVDAITVINGVHTPEPAFLPLAGLAVFLLRNR